ncbi:sensor histidine kinase [Pedobacter sp. NJ-S-72]
MHDVVANGLYRVMTEIENQDSLDRDSILDKLENMYEKSRDISYEELQFTDQNFHVKISDLLRSFATETTRIVLVGNTAGLWEKVSTQAKLEIEHVLQELMVNMTKHSSASNVAVKFVQTNNCINIYYTDNGIGISKEGQFNNGLTNTGNRIKSIHGEIIFETKAEKGLKVQISFPVS